MKEHNEIDELFRDGLENFKPDATHLSSASVLALLSTKASASAVVVKTGLLAKWGIGTYIGMATLVVGSTAAVVVYQSANQPIHSVHAATIAGVTTDQNAIDTVQQSLVVDSTFMLNSLSEVAIQAQAEKETTLDEIDQTESIIQQSKPQSEQVAVRVKSNPLKESIQSENNQQVNHTQRLSKRIQNNQLQSFVTFSNFPKKQSELNPIAAIQNTKVDALTASNSADNSVNSVLENTNSQSTAELKNAAAVAVDSTTVQAQLATTTTTLPVVSETESTHLNHSTVGTGMAYYNPFLAAEPLTSTYSWPRQHLSLKAGLGYVPLRTELTIYKEDVEDTLMLYYNFVETTYQRSTIKNEIGGSFAYQKAMRNNIVFGGGLNFSQGGWKAFSSVRNYYLVDDGFGNLSIVEEQKETGEWDVTYNSFGLNLFTGYDFIFNDHWMVGTSIGLNANQVFSKNNFRNYTTNEIETTKFSGFGLSVSGAFDLIYRMNQVGISVGGAINGRATTAKIIHATDFHNTASFSLNAGFHYFLDTKK